MTPSRREPDTPVCTAVVVDLDRPLAAIPTGGAPLLHVCALRHGRPIGTFFLDAPLDPMPARVVADEIERRFGWELYWQQLAAPLARPPRPGPPLTATVAVCTRDRPDDLARCLAALARLERALDVVVVDNASRDERTHRIVDVAGFRYVHEPLPGLDRARNRALTAIDTDVVLFTDDDVEVDAAWAERLLACFDDPMVMAATGLVLPARLDTPARLGQERHAGFSHRGVRRRVFDGTQVPPTVAGTAGAGASMAFRTGFLRSIGGFPEELDAGMPTCSGGDTYALYRVLRDGFRIVYEPAALAFHHHRDRDDELVRAAEGYGSGVVGYLAHAWTHDRDLHALRTGVAVVRGAVRDVAASVRRRAVPLQLSTAYLRGVGTGLSRYRRAREQVRARPAVTLAVPSSTVSTSSSSLSPAFVARSEARPELPALPSLSVVVPTRGRREWALRLLRALDGQRYAAPVEVIVCVDGDVDGTATAVEAGSWCHPVRVLRAADPDRPGGPGKARNAGAEAATGELLLFLDDDVEPVDDGFLAAHAAAHAAHPHGALVVGPVPPRVWEQASQHGRRVRNWWSDHVGRLSGDQPLTFTDVSSGNLSVRRDAFTALGGFADLRRREDWELGYRAQLAGLVIAAAPDAVAVHEAAVDLHGALEDRRAEGAGDAAFARRHPAVTWHLPLGHWPSLPRRQAALVELLFTGPERAVPVAHAAATAVRALDRVAPLRPWRQAYRLGGFVSYWSGVADELGSEKALADLIAAAAQHDRDRPVFDLAAPDRSALVTTSARFAEVRLHGAPLGLAPLHWGGVPWDAGRFETAVLDRFCVAAAPILLRTPA